MHSACSSQAHRTFAAFVMNGFVMLPDRRRKGSAGSALEAGSEGTEMQEQELPLEATVRCGTWSQLRRHLRLEFVSKYGGGAATDSLDGPGAPQGDELEESPADTGSFPARLRELVREFPKLSLEVSAFEAENSSQDPLEAHVALARCLALLRKRARADLWDLLAKAGPARACRQRPACACRGISHGTVLLCGMAPIRGQGKSQSNGASAAGACRRRHRLPFWGGARETIRLPYNSASAQDVVFSDDPELSKGAGGKLAERAVQAPLVAPRVSGSQGGTAGVWLGSSAVNS